MARIAAGPVAIQYSQRLFKWMELNGFGKLTGWEPENDAKVCFFIEECLINMGIIVREPEGMMTLLEIRLACTAMWEMLQHAGKHHEDHYADTLERMQSLWDSIQPEEYAHIVKYMEEQIEKKEVVQEAMSEVTRIIKH